MREWEDLSPLLILFSSKVARDMGWIWRQGGLTEILIGSYREVNNKAVVFPGTTVV